MICFIQTPSNPLLLKDITKISTLETVYKTASGVCDQVVVLASADDIATINFCKDKFMPCVFYEVNKPVLNLYKAAITYKKAPIMLLKGDCPAIPVELLIYAKKVFEDVNADYLSNMYYKTYPDGVEVDILSNNMFNFIAKISNPETNNTDIMSFIRDNQDVIKDEKLVTCSIVAPNFSSGSLRITTPESFKKVKESLVIVD